jgi:UDPglucose--hexose-1-phosphate uridylyltransferase
MDVIPRKYSFGGFELGTGMYVSSIDPEELAKKLKF